MTSVEVINFIDTFIRCFPEKKNPIFPWLVTEYMSPVSEDVLEGDKGLCQDVEFIDSWVDAVKTRAMIGNPLTICHNKEESSIDLKRLPVCRSHCLPRENMDELLSFKLYEELNSISCHKSLLCLHLHTCHPWQHMVLLSCRHDEKNICTAHKTTVDICVSHLCHLLKQAVSILVVRNGSFGVQD